MKVRATMAEISRSLLVLAGTAAAGSGCSAPVTPAVEPGPPWDLARTEIVEWRSDHPSFEQEFALEASGMAASGRYLYITSEKYSRLLVFDREQGDRVGLVHLNAPRHSELEGVARAADSLLFCDEAHAAVYELAPAGEEDLASATGELPVGLRKLGIEGVSVQGGKIGFEGIEVDAATGEILLLLERSGEKETGCVSRIFRLRREVDRLVAVGDPVDVVLEDCAWRLTGLAWWQDRLIGLKTQYPGERYEIVAVDLDTGNTEIILEMTTLLRSLADEGWSNNVEGIAVADDGALWLVADNAVTGVIDDPLPPAIDDRTLLLRVPRLGGR